MITAGTTLLEVWITARFHDPRTQVQQGVVCVVLADHQVAIRVVVLVAVDVMRFGPQRQPMTECLLDDDNMHLDNALIVGACVKPCGLIDIGVPPTMAWAKRSRLPFDVSTGHALLFRDRRRQPTPATA